MSSVTRRAVVWIALLLAATVLALPGVAAADGDPASDTLLGENVFYPYSPPVARAVKLELDRQTAAAKRAGFPIKVALIGAPTDLGAVPSLFGKPQAYAKFLDQEISFRAKPAAAGGDVGRLRRAGRRGPARAPPPSRGWPSRRARRAPTWHAGRSTAVAAGLRPAGHSLRSTACRWWRRLGRRHHRLLIVLVLAAIAVSTALIVLRVRRSST